MQIDNKQFLGEKEENVVKHLTELSCTYTLIRTISGKEQIGQIERRVIRIRDIKGTIEIITGEFELPHYITNAQ